MFKYYVTKSLSIDLGPQLGLKVYDKCTDKWEDSNGQERYSTEVVLQNFNSTLVMLDGRGDSAPAGAADIYDQTAGAGWDASADASSQVVDDDVPF